MMLLLLMIIMMMMIVTRCAVNKIQYIIFLFGSRLSLLLPHHVLPFHSCLTHHLSVPLFPAGRLCQGLAPRFILVVQVGILTLNYPSLL